MTCRRLFRLGFFGVALSLAIASLMSPAAADTYKPSTTLIQRIVTVQVNADGTATLTHDVARRADTPQGVHAGRGEAALSRNHDADSGG